MPAEFVEADLKNEVASLGALLGDARVRFRYGRPPFALSQRLIDLDLEIRNALALPLSAGLQRELRRLTARLRPPPFGGEHRRRHRRRVLQREARHLGGIDHSRLDQVFILPAGRVEAERALALAHPVDDDAALPAAVLHDLAHRLLERPADD